MHTSAACRNRESRSPGVPVPPSPASSPAFSRASNAVTCSSMLVPAAAAWAACALYQSISRSVSSVEMNAPCTRSSALLPGGRNSMSPFPSMVSAPFRVSAKVDSRTILDQNGAETMLGNGDMLFLPPGKSALLRVQGAFISTDETERLMDWYKAHAAQ